MASRVDRRGWEEEAHSLFRERVTSVRFRAVVDRLLRSAEEGEPWACQLVLGYVMGKPVERQEHAVDSAFLGFLAELRGVRAELGGAPVHLVEGRVLAAAGGAGGVSSERGEGEVSSGG